MKATALHQAVFLDHPEICKELLKHKDTNVNAVDEVRFTKILNLFQKLRQQFWLYITWSLNSLSQDCLCHAQQFSELWALIVCYFTLTLKAWCV